MPDLDPAQLVYPAGLLHEVSVAVVV